MSLLTAVTLLGLTTGGNSLTAPTTSNTISSRSRGSLAKPRNLFSSTTALGVGDFSSHPYSTYYGTSGSTAQQNLSQNDEMADMYGYHGPPGLGPGPGPMGDIDPMYADYYGGVNTHLDSMQDGTLRRHNMREAMREGLVPPPGAGPMRRGDFRPGLPPPLPRNNDMMDRVQERHMLDRLDELLYEHDTLRARLDDMENRVDESQRLQQEQTDTILNAVSQEHVESTKAMMENVLTELRNVQATLGMAPQPGRTPPPSGNKGSPAGAGSGTYSPRGPPPSPGSPGSPQSPPSSPGSPTAPQSTTSPSTTASTTTASPGATSTSSTIPPGTSSPPPQAQSPPPPPQASQQQQSPPPPPPPQASQPPPPPKPQINTTPPQQMQTGMGAEHTNPQNPTYNYGPPPTLDDDDDYHFDDDEDMHHDDDDDPTGAVNSFQQRAVGMRQPPPPPPRPTEPRRSLLRERVFEQKGRGENEMPYGPTAGGGGPPPPGMGGPPPPPGIGMNNGAPGFSTQGSVRSMDGSHSFGGRQQAPPPRSASQQPQPSQQRGPPINGGHASAGPPPGYFDDEDSDEDIWPKGGVNTFEPGQGPGQQQRNYERTAHRGATRSNSFGNFGGQTNGTAQPQRGRGRMSGFGGNGMGMGQGSGRSGGSTRSFGEESGSMTFTEGPDGGRCFLT